MADKDIKVVRVIKGGKPAGYRLAIDGKLLNRQVEGNIKEECGHLVFNAKFLVSDIITIGIPDHVVDEPDNS